LSEVSKLGKEVKLQCLASNKNQSFAMNLEVQNLKYFCRPNLPGLPSLDSGPTSGYAWKYDQTWHASDHD
jgi:hypothetical protein